MERALIREYEEGLDRLVAGLTPERLPLAVRIAEIPSEIRGFGHVKSAAAENARERGADLWAQWAATA
jgi:indolepyruvate ferredoxin oxidoreductase